MVNKKVLNTKNIKEITNKIPLGWKMGVVKRTIGGDVGQSSGKRNDKANIPPIQ